MNRRKFLGTFALAPLGFTFKNPFSGIFKRFFEPRCEHKNFDGTPAWFYHDNKYWVSGYKICAKCQETRKFNGVSYRVKYTTTLPPKENWAKHWRVKDLHG